MEAPSFHDVGVGSNRCHFIGIDHLRSDQYHTSVIVICGFDVMRSGVGCWYDVITSGIGMPAAERRGKIMIFFATSNTTIKSNEQKGILSTFGSIDSGNSILPLAAVGQRDATKPDRRPCLYIYITIFLQWMTRPPAYR